MAIAKCAVFSVKTNREIGTWQEHSRISFPDQVLTEHTRPQGILLWVRLAFHPLDKIKRSTYFLIFFLLQRSNLSSPGEPKSSEDFGADVSGWGQRCREHSCLCRKQRLRREGTGGVQGTGSGNTRRAISTLPEELHEWIIRSRPGDRQSPLISSFT